MTALALGPFDSLRSSNLVAFAGRCHRDGDTLVPGVVQGDVEKFRLVPERIEHHYEGVSLLGLCTADSFNEVPGVMFAEIHFTIFLVVW